ncbi:MAG: beta-ketoacyl-ACP synthase II [Candidatus Omnitrophota bacterium]
MSNRRVVITGLGVAAPNGIGKEEFWKANIEGRSGVGKITSFDVSNFESKICGQIKDLENSNYIPKEEVRKIDRFVHLGLISAKAALDDSRLDPGKEDKDRIGVIIGSGLGGLLFHEEQIMAAYDKGTRRINARSVPRISPNAVASHIAIQHGLMGPNMVISNACASGTFAIGEAFRLIQSNDMDVCLSGGAEAPLTEFTFGAYSVLRVLSRNNDFPQEASRPFDKKRDGFVLGEGSAVLILEELTHALKRNAHIYAEIAGYGSNSGAYHIVMPEPQGRDAAKAMRKVLQDAQAKPEDVDYINAHGTATTLNDKAETSAIKEVFGSHAYKIPVSSTKSMIGHSIGAAGAIEALVCALVIENNLIPPTINYKYPDPDCDLDYVPNQARKAKVDVVLTNSFGFGNCNGCLILKRYSD